MKATDLNLKKHGLMRGVKLVSIIEPRKHFFFVIFFIRYKDNNIIQEKQIF